MSQKRVSGFTRSLFFGFLHDITNNKQHHNYIIVLCFVSIKKERIYRSFLLEDLLPYKITLLSNSWLSCKYWRLICYRIKLHYSQTLSMPVFMISCDLPPYKITLLSNLYKITPSKL